MSPKRRPYIGLGNLIAIIIINTALGMLSLFTLAPSNYARAHRQELFMLRMTWFMQVILGISCAMVIVNAVYQYITLRKVDWNKTASAALINLLVSAVTIAGTYYLTYIQTTS